MSLSVILTILFFIAGSAFAYVNAVDLGTLSGYPISYGWSVNNTGQIVGWAEASGGDSRAVIFDNTGGGANTNLGGTASGAASSNGPQVVGTSNDNACIFDSTGGGANTNLGTLGGTSSGASSINNTGQIVGWASNSSTYQRACIFNTAGGANTDLQTLGGYESEATSVNNSGQIVGWADNSSNYSRACSFDNTGGGANIDLGSLGGDDSMAWSVNNSGGIVGWAFDEDGYYHACLFDNTGSGNNTDLGTLGGDFSEAYSINDIGQVVGYALDDLGFERACIFDLAGNIDLNSLIDPASGWTLMYAFDINNAGWIVGQGIYNGQEHAFLLVIPEPMTMVLLSLGGLILRYRQQNGF